MRFETVATNPSPPSFRRYRLRRRAVNAAGTVPAHPLSLTRRLCGRRVVGQHRTGAECRQSILETVAEICRRVHCGSAFARDDQPLPPASVGSVFREILRGMAIGAIACLALIWLAGASPLSYLAAVVWGSGLGALIGILLWIGSAEAPEDQVRPPAPGQARSRKPDKPRPRR